MVQCLASLHTASVGKSLLRNARFVMVMVSAWLKMTWRTVNTPNDKGVTALMAVASHGQTELLIQLLNRYARTDSQSRDGMTALMLASANGHAECADGDPPTLDLP